MTRPEKGFGERSNDDIIEDFCYGYETTTEDPILINTIIIVHIASCLLNRSQ